ncbi:MAG TPA: hypothetical protein VNU01_08880, partial [Egibacteraceae bacterium]|nr:hypothetical protein [Egibacteraceae bacterium]
MTDAVVFDAVRTPRGRGKATGALHAVKPISLVTQLIAALGERNPSLDRGTIDDIVLGVVEPHGDQGGDIARTAAIASGLPQEVAGVQLNRYCASGLEAVNQAAARVRGGWESLIVAGGVESMSRVRMGSGGDPWMMDPETSLASSFIPQGVSADLIATIEGYTRADVDAFAVESHHRAAKAWADGRFDRSVVPVRDRVGAVIIERDEMVRSDASLDSLSGLRPSFAQSGEDGGFDHVALQRYPAVESIAHVHHAGNSSAVVDV